MYIIFWQNDKTDGDILANGHSRCHSRRTVCDVHTYAGLYFWWNDSENKGARPLAPWVLWSLGAAFWGLCYHNSALCTFIQEWWDGSWNQLSISSTHQTKNGNLNIIRKTCLKKCFQKAQHCHNLRCLPILFYLASLTKGAIAAKFSKTNFLTNWDGYTDRKSFTWTHKDNDQR